MPSSRRSFLAALGAAGAFLSGCSARLPGSEPGVACGSVESAWPMAGHDHRRSGHAPDATLPSEDADVTLPTEGLPGLDGGLRAAPALVDGTAIVGTATNRIAALEPAGGPGWTVETESAVRTTPAVTCGHAYVASASATRALDPADGTVRWRAEVAGVLDPSASPVARGETVYVPTPSGIVALDARTGEEEFRADVALGTNGVAVAGDGLYATASGNGTGHVYGFWPDGRERWKLTPGRVLAAPAVGGTLAYAVTAEGRLLGIETSTGVVRFSADAGDGVHEGLAVADGTVYAPAGNGEYLHAFDAGTGEERWRHRTGVSTAAPVVAGDRVLAAGANTGIHVLDAETGEPERVYGRDELGLGIVGSSLAVGEGAIHYVEGATSNLAVLG